MINISEHYPFKLVPLPYSYDALKPYIDSETMHYHHDKHLQTYVDNLNKALSNYPQYHNTPLYTLIEYSDYLPDEIKTAVINNGGGVFNHNLYFYTMRAPIKNNIPDNKIGKAINRDFGSFEKFKEIFTNKALGVFGSGYAWLVKCKNGKLKIIPTPNQNTPVMPDRTPILPLDVWEHAYYLKYKNLRKDYIEGWFNLINWDIVNKLYMQ